MGGRNSEIGSRDSELTGPYSRLSSSPDLSTSIVGDAAAPQFFITGEESVMSAISQLSTKLAVTPY